MFKKISLLALPVAAAGALALSGVAQASVGGTPTGLPITATNNQTIAGWYATANDANVFPTHLSATLGSDGAPTLSNLTPSVLSNLSTNGVYTAGDFKVANASPNVINAGEGMGLINSDNGEAAEVGIVNIGNGLMDVVAGTGTLNGGVPNTPFGFAGLTGITDAYVLLANLPVTTSVDVELQMLPGYSHGSVSELEASARIAHNGNWHREFINCAPTPPAR